MSGSIFSMAWPAVLEYGMQTLVQYVDYIMVGSLGVTASAAVGLTTEINFLVKGPLIAMGIGVLAYISRSEGAGLLRQMKKASVQALYLAAALGLIEFIVMCSVSRSVPYWMGASEGLRDTAGAYLLIVSLPLLFQSYMIIGGSVLKGAGDMRTPMLVNAFMNLLNVLLNFLLIYAPREVALAGRSFALWGAGLGVTGAAIGTAVSVAAGGVLMTVGLWRNPKVTPRGECRAFDRNIARQCVRVGVPVALNRVVTSVGRVLFTAQVTSLGTMALAAHTIAFTAESAFYIPVVGLQAAVTTMAGNALGEQSEKKLTGLTKTAGLMIASVMSVMGVLLFVGAPWIMGVFTREPGVIAVGSVLLRIVAVNEPVFAVSIILEGIFNGIGDTKAPFYYSVLSMWLIRVFGVYACINLLGLGLNAVWLCMILDNGFRCLLLLWRYQRGRWREKFNLVEERNEL